MKLSTKGIYATRALLDLALHGDHGLVLAKDISGRIGVSESYLEQLQISTSAISFKPPKGQSRLPTASTTPVCVHDQASV